MATDDDLKTLDGLDVTLREFRTWSAKDYELFHGGSQIWQQDAEELREPWRVYQQAAIDFIRARKAANGVKLPDAISCESVGCDCNDDVP
jgi:hypothetical protein